MRDSEQVEAEADEANFGIRMSMLRGSYAITHWPEKAWAEVLSSYWNRLSQYPDQVRGQMFSMALKKFPDRFPTAGQLMALAEDRLKVGRATQAVLDATPRAMLPGVDGPGEELARRIEAGEVHGMDRIRAIGEMAAALDGPLAHGVGRSIPPPAPNVDDFCRSCGYPKSTHGTMAECAG